MRGSQKVKLLDEAISRNALKTSKGLVKCIPRIQSSVSPIVRSRVWNLLTLKETSEVRKLKLSMCDSLYSVFEVWQLCCYMSDV